MLQFFHGWRRKVGCVTLVMAVLLMMMWVRSYRIADDICVPLNPRLYNVLSYNGRLFWAGWNPMSELLLYQWISEPLTEENIEQFDNHYYGFEPRFRRQELNLNFENWEIGYWPVVLPLTLLSTCLLVIPSQKRSPAASQPDA